METNNPPARYYIAKIASPSDVAFRFWLQANAAELLPGERVAECLRELAPMFAEVEIHKSPETHSSFFRNLIVCSRIWHCPVCATRITEERRRELGEAVKAWRGRFVLVTYTVQHENGQDLQKILTAELEAYRGMKSGKAWQSLKKEYRWKGSVRTLEVTYGDNGWHPHVHELVFLERELGDYQLASFKAVIYRLWLARLKTFNLTADYAHGVDVRSARKDIEDYVTKFGHEPAKVKWGVEHEITKQPTKRGKKKGRTPTQLLADYGAGDIRSGEVWREYAMVFKGRNQLVWSRGLRELLGMGTERSDAEIADEAPNESILYGKVSARQWRILLRRDYRAALLTAVREMTEAEFTAWLFKVLGEESGKP